MAQLTQQEKRAKWRAYYHKTHQPKPTKIYYHQNYRRIVEHKGYSVKIYWSQQMLDYLKKNYATTINAELEDWLGVSYRTIRRKAAELGLKKDKDWLKAIWDERRAMAVASTKINGNSGCFKKGQHASPRTKFKKGSNKQITN